MFINEPNRVRPLLNDNHCHVPDAILAALNKQPNDENKLSRLFLCKVLPVVVKHLHTII